MERPLVRYSTLYYSNSDPPTYRTIVRLPTFVRSAAGLLSDEDERQLDNLLARDPHAGAVIRGTGGVRKLRVAISGRGKSGGARVVYYCRGSRERVYLILAYSKNVKENLTAAERSQMRRLTAILESQP